MTGTTQRVLVCVDSVSVPTSAWILEACPAYLNNGSTQYQTIAVVPAYVLDSSMAAGIEASLGPFDYVYAAGLWTLSFTFVVALFLVARSSGVVINFIRGRT
jgi:hypothetical protein